MTVALEGEAGITVGISGILAKLRSLYAIA
jgi:hypothetical protein